MIYDESNIGKTMRFRHLRSGTESTATVVGISRTPGFEYYLCRCVSHSADWYFKPGDMLSYGREFEVIN